MAHTREILLKDFFLEYSRFFIVENQIALIEGRNYYLIYAFFDTLSYIESKNMNLDTCKEKIKVLQESVKIFLSCSLTKYPYVKYIEEYSDISIEQIDFKEVIKIFNNSVGNMFDNFYKTYSLVSNYKQVEIVEELLIEFNNFLSHFVKHIANQDLSSGISHLYRGCLDGYKDIILENNILLLSNTNERDKFINLRLLECDNIGKNEFDKMDILYDYQQISVNLLTTYICNEKN
jgi:hypothetical protein